MSGNEAQLVLADAQFGLVQLMQPVTDFESTYEGQSADIPIYLFPERKNVDPLAEKNLGGYASNLARGLPVPLGARVVLWLPNLTYADGPTTLGYQWIIIWRMRNVIDFRQGNRKSYHYPKDQGAIDNTLTPPGSRVPIPAAYNTITYIQTEPTTEPGRAVNNVHAEDVEASADKLSGPLIAGGGTQPIQQGIFDPDLVADAAQPAFLTHDFQALGDELLIALRRSSASIANWTFATTDANVANLLGDGLSTGDFWDNFGAYVMVGASP